jgi:hypothetical protein
MFKYKKNNILNYVLISFLFLFIFGCKENPQIDNQNLSNTKKKSFLNSLMSDSLTNNIFQVGSIRIITGQSDPEYSIIGNITHGTLSLNGGEAYIDGIGPFYPDSNNNWQYGYGGPMYFTNQTIPTFGQTKTWSLSGNQLTGVPGFDTTMYLPKDIYISDTNIYSGLNVSKSNDFILSWNSDLNNPNGILIYLDYRPVTSRNIDSTLPNNQISWQTIVSDNGSYTISRNVLQQFPVGGHFDLYIGRANNTLVTKGSYKYYLVGYTYATLELIMSN